MIAALTLEKVEEFCRSSLNAVLHNGDATFTRVNTDTRKLAAGELFIALRGENFDAHNFLSQAAEKNVCGLVVEKFDPSIALPQLVVSDSLLALGQIAAMNRAAFSGKLLAITGSSGKTTVKTMLANILRECGEVWATQGNFNNHIGVPLTLLQLEAKHQYAVIEMGASAIGEIEYLCSLAKPSVSMVNNIMPAHIEGFGSIEGVARAKSEIYQQLPQDGTAVVNLDEPYAAQWLPHIHAQIATVSLSQTAADCFAKNISFAADAVEFTLVIKQQEVIVQINALGEHSVRNALMAAAMASAVGATPLQIKRGLENFAPVSGRMSRHSGFNNALVIDDSYNANPGSVRAAIDVLSASKGLRILVLGDLAELGDDAASLHADLGIYAKNKIDRLFTLGALSQHASESFGGAREAAHFTSRDDLVQKLKSLANAETTFLIKGSRSAKMDLVVNALTSLQDNHGGEKP